MKKQFTKIMSMLLVVAMLLSLGTATVFADSVKLEDYVDAAKMAELGKNYPVAGQISLAENMTGVSIAVPVEGTTVAALQEAIAAGTVTLNLVRNPEHPYVDSALYPNQKAGGPLTSWKINGNKIDMFKNVAMTASEVEGKVVLTVTFDTTCYYNTDLSMPHSNGGAYLDACGYFFLSAVTGETTLGSAEVKIVPYDNFHTMDEIYVQEQEIVDRLKAAGLYASYEIAGYSTAGRPIPYMVISDSAESVSDWMKLTEKAETQPAAVLEGIKNGEYDSIRVPAMYSNIHSNEVAATDGVLDFGWMLVDAMENNNGKLNYKMLTGFTEAGEAQLAAELASRKTLVPDLVKDTATYLGWLRNGASKSAPVDMAKFYTMSDNEITVEQLLKNVFFVLMPEENVDGRTYITRQSSNGYDLNRDNSFQTTSETICMQKLIGTLNPVSLTEFHGRVTAFQCEPCDPPHEPNFEYDLLANHLVTGGEALGIAAVANNTAYNSYVIPQRDYLTTDGNGEPFWDAWDDMSTSYTPQFAMLQGTVAYTVELPAYDDNTADLVTYGILGQAAYIGAEKLGYLTSQVEIYNRGVKNMNSDAYELVGQWLADQKDVEGAEMDLFRPEFKGEGQNGNFYPECYIIPMDGKNQKNLQAAYDMMVWLARNDVKVNVTTAEFTYNGVTYPAGTMIISMYQAKRSVANSALYDGTPIHTWSTLYSEGITSFNETRGFNMAIVAEPAAYKTIAAVMGEGMDFDAAETYVSGLGSCFTGVEGADVIIVNSSEDSTAAVNALLSAGCKVGLITEGEYKTSFVVSYEDYASVADQYVVTAIGVKSGAVKANVLKNDIKVYLTGVPANNAASGFVFNSQVSSANAWNYDRVAMELMGFSVTENVAEADIIAGASSLSGAALNAAKAGTPYIGYSSSANRTLASGITRTGLSGSMDCLEFVTYPNETMVNASYIQENDNVMYGYGYGYFSKIPEGATVLVQADGEKSPTECFIPLTSASRQTAYNTYRATNGVLGFEYKDETVDFAIFANSLTNKGHQRDEYSFISNFIFSRSMTDEVYAGEALAITAQPETFVGKVGDTASFSVEVNRTDVTYQWYYSNNGWAWSKSTMEGAATASLSVPMKAYRVGQQYKVVVTDSLGNTVESDVVALAEVTSELKFVKNPADAAVAVGKTATFTAEAQGEGVTYQWMYSNNQGKTWSKSTAPGATTASMSIEVKAYRVGQMYKCVATDANGVVVESAVAAILAQ